MSKTRSVAFMVALVGAALLVQVISARQVPVQIGSSAGIRSAASCGDGAERGRVRRAPSLTTGAAVEHTLTRGLQRLDDGVAAMLVGGVVEQDLVRLRGEGLVLVYPQRDKKVTSVVGQGWAPKGATIEWYKPSATRRSKAPGSIPSSSPALHMRRSRCSSGGGRRSFEAVSARAIEYAQKGFPRRPRDC